MSEVKLLPAAEHMEALENWLREQSARQARNAESRAEMARTNREGTAEEWRAGHRMAEQMMGRKLPVTTVAELKRDAQMYDHLAAKSQAEADRLLAWAYALHSARTDRVSIEVYQHDWIEGFAAFADDGSVQEHAKAHVVLNLGSLLCAVEKGDIERADLPYMVAESLMHEAMHVLEAWANVEFNEERVERLLMQYRESIDHKTIWRADCIAEEDAQRPGYGEKP